MIVAIGLETIRSSLRRKYFADKSKSPWLTLKDESDEFRSFMNIAHVTYMECGCGSIFEGSVKFIEDELSKAYEEVIKLPTKQDRLDAAEILCKKIFGKLHIKNECEYEKLSLHIKVLISPRMKACIS